MKKIILITFAVVVFVVLGRVGIFYWKNLRGASGAFLPPKKDVGEEIVSSKSPFTVADGFEMEVFAKNLPAARVLALDANGNIWVSQTKKGLISIVQMENGRPVHQHAVFESLKNPHGLAFDPQDGKTLYFAEEHQISKAELSCLIDTLPCENLPPEKIIDLPSGGRHTTRTIEFGPDGRLYVSIGSSCDVCHEEDKRRGAIYSMNPDGSDFKEFARGLRNAVFFTWAPDTKTLASSGAPGVWKTPKMWATEMGRDHLGDNLPPDEINLVEEGKNYGWPICYGYNVHDTEFDKNTYIRNPCMSPHESGSYVNIPAHSAPLGIAFVPSTFNWPELYRNKMLVAYHGSWTRTEPTGYKVVFWLIEPEHGYGSEEGILREPPAFWDFISGWLEDDGGVLGRPVDLLFDESENLYISDDKAGVIYRVRYVGDE